MIGRAHFRVVYFISQIRNLVSFTASAICRLATRRFIRQIDSFTAARLRYQARNMSNCAQTASR
jgi:hypothetical protein